uniref:Zn(2)-C6 fungal-type domain-containing protein n=1 Tax=Kwoniella dejecticola CBS 10117 TaxID=1296121 RepID=A0A1A5ZZZ3_9TREE|nr:uncharacterized protein I303_06933 [Kwoniella dejecticola CBS 10117]OBR83368.1 hypothetical protein I303_06933 [Kwoniella dejecticola CBS 10117]
MAESSTGPPPAKRRKARRACDPCRNRKLRCEYPEDAYNQSQSKCFACQRSGAECESTQPAKIDKRRLRTLVDLATTDEQKQWVAAQIASRGVYVSSTDAGALRKARPSTIPDPAQLVARLSSASPSIPNSHASPHGVENRGVGFPKSPKRNPFKIPTRSNVSPRIQDFDPSVPAARSQPGQSPTPHPDPLPQARPSAAIPDPSEMPRRGSDEPPNLKLSGPEPRMQGPTATINLLADLPEDSAALDRRYGLFRVTEGWVYGANPDVPMREGQLSEQQIREDVIAKLISFYTDQIAPLNPVIPPHRISQAIENSPFVLSSILAVAALSRAVPSSIYASIRERLQKDLDHELGKGSTLQQVQALLISGMSHELHGETNMEGGSNCWIRIGTAIRQAQDIGLHRLNAGHWLPDMYADRARAWLAAIITDRWYGGAYGQPLAVSLLDCEDPLASSDILQTPDYTHAFQVEMFHVMQTIYRPRSLERCTDAMLESLLRQVDSRLSLIPEPFLFVGRSTSVQGGLLSLVTVSTEVIFFRSFVKHNRKLPPHLTFRPTAGRWSRTVQRARQVISWLNQRGDHILDCWLIAKYAIVYAALAQYYTYAAERDVESLESLSVAKDMMNRWALGHNQLRPIAARAKIADIINLFYKAALGMRSNDLDPIAQITGQGYINIESGTTQSRSRSVNENNNENDVSLSTSTPGAITHPQSTLIGGNITSTSTPTPTSTFTSNQKKAHDHALPEADVENRLDTSTLDDWLADFFRQHDIPDSGLANSAMYQDPAF